MTTTTLKQIAVSEANYNILKSLGKAGDSFNDVITVILRGTTSIKSDPLREESNKAAHRSRRLAWSDNSNASTLADSE
jgi:hypothetical protein